MNLSESTASVPPVVIEAPLESAPPVRVFGAEVIEERVAVVDERGFLGKSWGFVGSACEWLFGVASLWVGLAFLATFPVLQFLSLGYLLEVSGRIARTGRIRDGFIGVRKAARIGSFALGTWLVLWPLRFLSDIWYSAWLIDPNSPTTRGWRVALIMATGLVAAHLVWAWLRGGRLRHFFWPAPFELIGRLTRGGLYREARDGAWEFVVSLRLPYYFWLGVRGFAGAVAWLFLPVLLLVAAFYLPTGLAVLSGLFGGLLLMFVVLYLPFLQGQFACENRLVALFDIGRAHAAFRRAPIAFWISVVIVLLFALPLYLLKIEFVEREVAGVSSLVFVIFIAPGRLLAGWALARGRRREQPRLFLTRWLAWTTLVPVGFFYVLMVYLSRYVSWYGSWSLFEQHAFLVPVPFLGL